MEETRRKSTLPPREPPAKIERVRVHRGLVLRDGVTVARLTLKYSGVSAVRLHTKTQAKSNELSMVVGA